MNFVSMTRGPAGNRHIFFGKIKLNIYIDYFIKSSKQSSEEDSTDTECGSGGKQGSVRFCNTPEK